MASVNILGVIVYGLGACVLLFSFFCLVGWVFFCLCGFSLFYFACQPYLALCSHPDLS